MKVYDFIQLKKMDFIDLCYTADEYGIDFTVKSKSQLVYLIIDAQEKFQNKLYRKDE